MYGSSQARCLKGAFYVLCVVICASVVVCAQMASQHAITAQAQLLKGEQVSKAATSCISVTLGPKSVYVPNFVIRARFDSPVSGYFEIDGARVASWKKEQDATWAQQYVKQRVYRITLGVDTPANVRYLSIDSSEPVTEIREVRCLASPKAQ